MRSIYSVSETDSMSSLVKVNVTVDLQNEEQLKKDSLIILSEIR